MLDCYIEFKRQEEEEKQEEEDGGGGEEEEEIPTLSHLNVLPA